MEIWPPKDGAFELDPLSCLLYPAERAWEREKGERAVLSLAEP